MVNNNVVILRYIIMQRYNKMGKDVANEEKMLKIAVFPLLQHTCPQESTCLEK